MRLMKRMSVLLLSLLFPLSLAACGAKNEEGSIREGLYYEASGISPDAVLLRVNGQAILAEDYLYWLCYTCDYVAGYLGEDIDWDEARGEQTLGDYVKQEALNNTVLYAIVEQWAEKYNCPLTEEDRRAMEAEYNYYVDSYGGEEAYDSVLAQMGTNRERARKLAGDYYLYSHLFDQFQQPGSALYPTEAERADFLSANSYLTADHILISTAAVADGDEAAKAALRKRGEEALGKLRAGEDFAAVAAVYSDDPSRAEYPEGYTFALGSGAMEPKAEAAADALAEGEISELVAGSDGFYLIRRLPLNRSAVDADFFDQKMSEAQKNAELSCSAQFDALESKHFFTALLALRKELSRAAPAAAVPPASEGSAGQPASEGSAGRPASEGSAGQPASEGSAGRPAA